MIRGARFLIPKLLFQTPLFPQASLVTARLVAGSVTTSESLVLYVFLEYFPSVLDSAARGEESEMTVHPPFDWYRRQYAVDRRN